MDEITEGSGNIFVDLSLDNAEELTLKAALALKVNAIVAHRSLSQAEAGRLLGIPQPKVSKLRNGNLDGFSVEKLMEFLVRLGRDIDIVVGGKTVHNRAARIRVGTAGRGKSAAA